MQRHGWTLLFHDCLFEQLEKLRTVAEKACLANPEAAERNANVKLYRTLGEMILNVVPSDPGRDEFRQGKTLGAEYRHWRRAKFGQRFRLFFRFDSRSKIIIFAWVNDEQTLRSAGSKTDPYAVFRRMLLRDHPPDEWRALVAASRPAGGIG